MFSSLLTAVWSGACRMNYTREITTLTYLDGELVLCIPPIDKVGLGIHVGCSGEMLGLLD